VRQARDVEEALAGDVRRAHRVLDAPPQHVELALVGEVVLDRIGPREEALPHHGLAGAGGRAEGAAVGRHRAPAQEPHALLGGDALDDLLAAPAVARAGRQEEEAGAVAPRVGQPEAGLAAGVGEEAVRHLHEDAGAVAGVLLAAAGPAVLQVQQHLDRLVDDRVRATPVSVDHEADAAGVVLEAGVVQPLRARTFGVCHLRAFLRPERPACRQEGPAPPVV
jgi:hypothetical protein